ncbi:TetR/AcrR family transcriptional regulator [Streptomyces sp. NPDC001982]|uniref:TetR/AcrR family transcriptional regulator n=1 Tax=Streptomyces sp. NPDC001982 TaxID=3154405 RepID=UPI003329B021
MARPRKFDEAQVMRAAMDQFWTAGYAGTSLDNLAEITGLGRGSLYGAFGDKHALFLRALRDYCCRAIDEWRAKLTGPGAAYERLAQYLRDTVARIAADSERRGCMLAKSTAELAATDPAVTERAAATLNDLHAALAGCIAEAQREGALSPEADADKLASMLLAVLRGIEALGKSGIDPAKVTEAAEQALALLPRTAPAQS